MWITLGLGFLGNDQERFSRPGPGDPLQFLDDTPLMCASWLVAGVVALVNGIIRRWIRDEDAFGFAALMLPPASWATAYGWSYATYLFSGGALGRPSAAIGCAVMAAFATFLLLVARWPDPADAEYRAIGRFR
jgi:hypothetical protein